MSQSLLRRAFVFSYYVISKKRLRDANLKRKSLSERLAIDSIDLNRGHLRTSGKKIDVIDAAGIASHRDGRRSGVEPSDPLRPDVKGCQGEVFSADGHVESFVFGSCQLPVEVSFNVGRWHRRRRRLLRNGSGTRK